MHQYRIPIWALLVFGKPSQDLWYLATSAHRYVVSLWLF